MTDNPMAGFGAMIITPDDEYATVIDLKSNGILVIDHGKRTEIKISEAVLWRPAPLSVDVDGPWVWDRGWQRLVPVTEADLDDSSDVDEAWNPDLHPRDENGRFAGVGTGDKIDLVDEGPMTSVIIGGENRGSIFPADLLGGPAGSWTAAAKGIGSQKTFGSRDEAIAHVSGAEVQRKATLRYDKTPKARPSHQSSTGSPAYTGNDALHLVRPANDQFNKDSSEAKAIRDYTDVKFKAINDGLRRGRGTNDTTVKGLDKAFSEATPTTREIVVKRVVNNGDQLFGPVGSRVGETHTEHAYVSTSTGGGIGGGSHATVMTIEVPPGSKVIRPGTIGNHGDSEGEIILNRNTSYDIVNDEMVGTTRQVTLRLHRENVSEAATHPPPYNWRHGWKPLNPHTAKKYRKRWPPKGGVPKGGSQGDPNAAKPGKGKGPAPHVQTPTQAGVKSKKYNAPMGVKTAAHKPVKGVKAPEPKKTQNAKDASGKIVFPGDPILYKNAAGTFSSGTYQGLDENGSPKIKTASGNTATVMHGSFNLDELSKGKNTDLENDLLEIDDLLAPVGPFKKPISKAANKKKKKQSSDEDAFTDPDEIIWGDEPSAPKTSALPDNLNDMSTIELMNLHDELSTQQKLKNDAGDFVGAGEIFQDVQKVGAAIQVQKKKKAAKPGPDVSSGSPGINEIKTETPTSAVSKVSSTDINGKEIKPGSSVITKNGKSLIVNQVNSDGTVDVYNPMNDSVSKVEAGDLEVHDFIAEGSIVDRENNVVKIGAWVNYYTPGDPIKKTGKYKGTDPSTGDALIQTGTKVHKIDDVTKIILDPNAPKVAKKAAPTGAAAAPPPAGSASAPVQPEAKDVFGAKLEAGHMVISEGKIATVVGGGGYKDEVVVKYDDGSQKTVNAIDVAYVTSDTSFIGSKDDLDKTIKSKAKNIKATKKKYEEFLKSKPDDEYIKNLIKSYDNALAIIDGKPTKPLSKATTPKVKATPSPSTPSMKTIDDIAMGDTVTGTVGSKKVTGEVKLVKDGSVIVVDENGKSFLVLNSDIDQISAGSSKTPASAKVNTTIGNKSLVDPATFFSSALKSNNAYHHVTGASSLDLTYLQRDAIRKYTGSHYTTMNNYLRHSDKPGFYMTDATIASTQKTIKYLDEAFSKAPKTTEPMKVVRGTSDATKIFGEIGDKVGKTFSDKAYLSTTTKEGGTGFGFSDRAHIEIMIPPGAQVLRPNGEGSYGDMEREILLPRGSNFKVVSDENVPGKDRRIILEMIV